MAEVTPSSKMQGSPTRRRATARRESASRTRPTAQADEHAEEQAEDAISASDLATAATKQLVETLKTVLLSFHFEQPGIVFNPAATGVVMWIDSLAPSLILENRPARAFFTIYNGTPDTQPIGFVGASIQPLHSINPLGGDTTFQIPKLQPLEMVSGVVSFTAPRSDLKNVLTLSYYQFGPIVAEFPSTILIASASQDFDIGARYVIKPNQISISATASLDDDTLFMGFSGRCGDVTDDESKSLGDHSEGVSLSFKGLGPIDSIPGISPTAVIYYTVINNGHSDAPAKILDDISDVCAGIVTAVATILYGPAIGAAAGAISEAIDALTKLFNDNVFKSCDCQLISDSHTISSQQLYDSTFDAADLTTSSQVWDQQDGPSPCFDNHWRYRLAWEIIRQRSPLEVATVTPRYSSIPLSQELSLVGADTIAGPLGRTGWEWDVVAGTGKVDENGRFKAPSVSDPPSNYAVVRARHVLNGEQKSVGYAIVQFD
jgi:hypothetical protein